MWSCGNVAASAKAQEKSCSQTYLISLDFSWREKKVNFQPWVASKCTSEQGHPPVRTLTRPLSTKLLYQYMASTMAEFYSRSSNTCYILPQKCIRNYLDRRHKIPHFPGGACPQTLVGTLRTLYYVAPASQYACCCSTGPLQIWWLWPCGGPLIYISLNSVGSKATL